MSPATIDAIGSAIRGSRKHRAVSLRLGAEDAARLQQIADEAGVRTGELARLLVVRAMDAIASSTEVAA